MQYTRLSHYAIVMTVLSPPTRAKDRYSGMSCPSLPSSVHSHLLCPQSPEKQPLSPTSTSQVYTVRLSTSSLPVWNAFLLLVLRSNDYKATSQPRASYSTPHVRTNSPLGTIITINNTIIPTIIHIRIFMSFHHICFRTLLAPRLNPCADVAKLSVLSCNLLIFSPRSEALTRLDRIWSTALATSYTRIRLARLLRAGVESGL